MFNGQRILELENRVRGLRLELEDLENRHFELIRELVEAAGLLLHRVPAQAGHWTVTRAGGPQETFIPSWFTEAQAKTRKPK